MSNVRAFLAPTPPEILYHYTTPAGLLGIISNGEIWAGHTQYLNDQREFKHAISIIDNEIGLMKRDPQHAGDRELLDDMVTALKDRETMNVCVCSFSERGDVLSQWRAYSGAAGFSIGFRGEFRQRISESQQFWLTKCIYDEEQQRNVMRTLLNDVLRENQSLHPSDDKRVPGGNLREYLNRYAPILKHKTFEEEQEWRIISQPLSCTRHGFDFRAGPSMLIPFFRVPLSTDGEPFHIEEIVIGPTPHSRQSRRALQSLLTKYDLRDTKVRNTQTPFRNW
jgi:hypothetical protein